MLFGGCFNNYINSSDKNAAANIIEKLGYSVKYIDKCCGYPYFSEGNTEKFYNNIKNIIDLVEKNNYKYLICTCDTCYNSLKKIPEFVKNSEKIANKIITFDKFLQINNYNNNNSESIKYFKPLLREEKLPVENIEVINKKSTCSLMENFLLLKYFKNVEKYLNLIYNSLDINNKTILTTCNLTKFGIIKGLTKLNSMSEVLSYAEFIELEEMKKKNID